MILLITNLITLNLLHAKNTWYVEMELQSIVSFCITATINGYVWCKDRTFWFILHHAKMSHAIIKCWSFIAVIDIFLCRVDFQTDCTFYGQIHHYLIKSFSTTSLKQSDRMVLGVFMNKASTTEGLELPFYTITFYTIYVIS